MRWWVALLSLLVALAGCGRDYGQCLRHHYTTVLQPMWIGKTMIMFPQRVRVCDQWEFPNGREPAKDGGVKR